MIGKVKFFNESKGYGFIIVEESGVDYFMHVSGLTDNVKQGDTVSFELEDGKKGKNAVDVCLIQDNGGA